jgi:serine/threonine-protein kinase
MGDLRADLAAALGDGFDVRRVLGSGGFATVYAVYDHRLKREVAVKVLRPELLAAPAVRERFQREAEAVARLRHPNIIPIFAVGETADLAYFVMPLIAGESLQARLDREQRLPVDEVRRILRETADALASAHRAGVVHRDIKPDNLLLEGPERRVVVTDFGIAKAVRGDDQVAPLTATGVVVGTPQYMSPEQAGGEGPIDHRSDIYSLGVVGYQMLAGQPPFGGATVAAILLKHITEEPQPVTRARPDCPADLAAAINRCLLKDPARRWSAVEDLQRALATTSAAVATTIATAAPRRLDPPRRFRRAAMAGALLVLAAVLADVRVGHVAFAPVGIALVTMVLALMYGRLWTLGFSWRELVRPGQGTFPLVSPVPVSSIEFGTHAPVIAALRSDRAAILAVLAGLPAAERAPLAGVIPAVDARIARAADLARQLVIVERQLDPGPEELERRMDAARQETPSPGREQRIAVLQRRLSAVHGLAARRESLATALGESAARLTAIRAAVERTRREGSTAAVVALLDTP